MNWFKYVTWSILVVLSLIMAFLFYARQHPNLLAKLVGPYGNPGQLGSIRLSGDENVVIEEIVDNDHGIGVEGGAGFSVQLKKLIIFNLKKQQKQTLGFSINTKILGATKNLVWVFDEEKGLKGLSVENGEELASWKSLIKVNPELNKRSENSAERFQIIDQNLWISDFYGHYWQLDDRLKVHFRDSLASSYRPLPSGNIRLKRSDHFLHGFFLINSQSGLKIEANNPKGYFVFYYQTVKNEGFRLAHLRESGKIIWNKNLDDLLERKAERCRPAWAYPYKNTLCLVLETNRGTRLVLINVADGRVLKNLRV
ncbi:MAG: hypothetical protein ACKOW2_00230 [Sphingobacteriaceae bacterium]